MKASAAVNLLVAAALVLAGAVSVTSDVPAYSGHVQEWYGKPVPGQFRR